MTDNNKHESNDTSLSKSPEQNNAATESADEVTHSNSVAPAKDKGSNHGLTMTLTSVSLCVSLIAIATSGWLYYQSTISPISQNIQQLKVQQDTLTAELKTNQTNKAQLDQVAKDVIRAQQSAQQETKKLTQQQIEQSNKIQSLEAKLQRLNNTTKEDWKLAEAEYLIRLANQRLLLEADTKGAISLLSNADDILKEQQDPITFDTRKALAKDIQALSATSQFDLEGKYLQLTALHDSIITLPQREPSKEWQKSQQDASSEDTTTTSRIESELQNFWQSLRSLVVINYQHKPIKALLPPAEYQELTTGLQLQLDVAQVALMKGETLIYQQALSRVATAITEHFDTQSNLVTSFLASLTELQQIDPSPTLPLPRSSLLAMKNLMKDWNQRQPTDNNADPASTEQPSAVENKTKIMDQEENANAVDDARSEGENS
ncbi:uroporphyrinogen-III C-methyltransferase [Marinomonas aquiplantarum]|uniref:Uroporphyrin-3 C-methyltransferase n=1 Tax=Marinomonas aquiplantarum TaxID=491951 RepID=A0A366CSR4_9GAMM|nr:uroporphyrinogen-III C-methyltransferase [Marinomonas aquiplantarum]RBO78392.1 uroporphyrin-3 C-methyltransferase [Marinomonas aquiplantarum]